MATATRRRPRTLTNGWKALAIVTGLLALGQGAWAVSRPDPAALVETRIYGDPNGARSTVTRDIAADGGERLRATTEVSLRGQPAVIEEEAQIDAAGKLVDAEMTIARGGARRTLRYDARAGFAQVLGSERFQTPNDAPWVYGPADIDGDRVATPVAAWVAMRAVASARARGEESTTLRWVDAQGRVSHLVPADQVTVDTEGGTTVVLGDDGVDVGKDFLIELRMAAAGTTLRLQQTTSRL
jgi:hypothetical protein